jgi:Trk K+ transport system NAD-binding subunit
MRVTAEYVTLATALPPVILGVSGSRVRWRASDSAESLVAVDAAPRTIGQVGLPRGAIIVSLVRQGTLMSPTPQQTLDPGDTITVLARPAQVETIQQLLPSIK